MKNFLNLFLELGKLKTIKRSGWVVEGIENVESIAEHSFRTAAISLFLAAERKDLDLNRCVKMALVHDFAESQIGDVLVDWKISFHDKQDMRKSDNKHHGVSQEEKHEIEKKAMIELTKNIPNGNEVFNLWMEFEKQETKESIFVKSVDKLEMFIQALEYERAQKKDLNHWFNDKRNHPNDPQIIDFFKYLLSLRK